MIATCLSNRADQQAEKKSSSRTPQHIEQSSVKPAFHKFTSGAWNMELHVPQTFWNLEHRNTCSTTHIQPIKYSIFFSTYF
jgi:hypothetical protein